jgi:two-component system, cell cycle response regulator
MGVGSRLSLLSEELDEVVRAAELHDVGKMAIPDEILHKPGPLTDEEWSFVRQHTIIGERILGAAPALLAVAKLVRASHEHWDGSGYPDGLAGETIPLGARVVAVCDAFDAMTTSRPYRDAMSVEEALTEIRACSGTQFDPTVVEAFCEEIASLPHRYGDRTAILYSRAAPSGLG